MFQYPCSGCLDWRIGTSVYCVFSYTHILESKSEGLSVLSDSLQPHGLYSPWNSLGQNTGVGSHSLLQRIVPTQGSNPDLPHYRGILYQLSHKGSPGILEWVAYPLSRGASQPRNQTGVWFFTNWDMTYIAITKFNL